MSTLKISYNGSEISSVDATSPVSVAYNSATIATLNDGDTKTLDCHGKVMASDVGIGGKTLNCSGKLMQGDIVVELVGSAPSSGETWYFNETLSYTKSFNVQSGITSNGTHYQWLKVGKSFLYGSPAIICYLEEYPSTGSLEAIYAPLQYGWADAAFRTFILDEPATGDFLAFLEVNATKIS